MDPVHKKGIRVLQHSPAFPGTVSEEAHRMCFQDPLIAPGLNNIGGNLSEDLVLKGVECRIHLHPSCIQHRTQQELFPVNGLQGLQGRMVQDTAGHMLQGTHSKQRNLQGIGNPLGG